MPWVVIAEFFEMGNQVDQFEDIKGAEKRFEEWKAVVGAFRPDRVCLCEVKRYHELKGSGYG